MMAKERRRFTSRSMAGEEGVVMIEEDVWNLEAEVVTLPGQRDRHPADSQPHSPPIERAGGSRHGRGRRNEPEGRIG